MVSTVEIFEVIRASLSKSHSCKIFSGTLFGCYISGPGTITTFPTIKLTFGSLVAELKPESYAYSVWKLQGNVDTG